MTVKGVLLSSASWHTSIRVRAFGRSVANVRKFWNAQASFDASASVTVEW